MTLLVALAPLPLLVGVGVADREVPEAVLLPLSDVPPLLLRGMDTGPGAVGIRLGEGITVVIVSVRAGLKKVSVIVVVIPLEGVEMENVLSDLVPLNVPEKLTVPIRIEREEENERAHTFCRPRCRCVIWERGCS